MDPQSKMGAIVNEEQTNRIVSYIEEGKERADLVTGGNRVFIDSKGCFIQPTIFNNVNPADTIAKEEIFGPVLSVIPFETEEQALKIANKSEYGLAASVWTDDLSRALRVSDNLHAGTVSINTVDALNTVTPFGGIKQSGYGKDLSLHSFNKYTSLKTKWIKYKS